MLEGGTERIIDSQLFMLRGEMELARNRMQRTGGLKNGVSADFDLYTMTAAAPNH